jgi:predicted  nucleic acid-binding Zn-ribbon protein
VLRTLHRIHRQIGDLKSRIDRGPRQIRAGEQAVAQAEHDVTERKAAWKKMRMESDAQQLQLRQREAKIDDLQRKLNECKTNTEFKTLKDQIAAEKQANSVLEDEILERLERLDVLQNEIHEAEVRQRKTHEELEKTKQRVEAQQASLEADLARVHAELAEAETALPEEIRAEYQRMVRAHGEEGLAAVESESCGGCNTILTMQTINQLYRSRPIFCPTCGALLYLATDRTPQ